MPELESEEAAARRDRARAIQLHLEKKRRLRDNLDQIQLHLELLVHASGCVNQACPSANCSKMKALLKHGATCTMRATGGCHKCRRCWALLQIHARQCRQTEGAPAGRCCRYRACPVPRCRDLKEHLRWLQRQQEEKEEEASEEEEEKKKQKEKKRHEPDAEEAKKK